MRKNSLKVMPIVILLLLASAIAVNARSEGINVVVRGRAISVDEDHLRNDIMVSGKIMVETTETEVKVKIYVEITGPDGGDSQKMTLYGSGDGSNYIIIDYQTIFADFITAKGMYRITVTVDYGKIEATGSHQFDPPGGGAGPPR